MSNLNSVSIKLIECKKYINITGDSKHLNSSVAFLTRCLGYQWQLWCEKKCMTQETGKLPVLKVKKSLTVNNVLNFYFH